MNSVGNVNSSRIIPPTLQELRREEMLSMPIYPTSEETAFIANGGSLALISETRDIIQRARMSSVKKSIIVSRWMDHEKQKAEMALRVIGMTISGV